MTPDQLRKIIERYQNAKQLPSFTQAVEAFAIELSIPTLPIRHGTVWAWLKKQRGIRPVVEARIKQLTDGEVK